MTVGELRGLLANYDPNTHVAIVWPRPQQLPDGPWLAEIEKLISAAHTETGEIDLFLEAIEVV